MSLDGLVPILTTTTTTTQLVPILCNAKNVEASITATPDL